ncbi:MAG: hypothetical protein ABIH66_00675 [bacterium]
MIKRAAKPRHINFSESLDRFLRTKRNFAVRPCGVSEERWADQRISSNLSEEVAKEQEQKRLIHDVSEGVKGIQFAAEEMAKVIRGWMAQDE